VKLVWPLILLLIACTGFSGCNKNTIVDQADVWLPAEIKSLFLFYPGSYWIMEFPGTNYVDSIFVESTRIDTVPILHPGSRAIIGHKERLVVRYVSTFYGRRFEHRSDAPDFCNMLGDPSPCQRISMVNLNASGAVNTRTFIYMYPSAVKQAWPTAESSENRVYVDSILPSYSQFDSSYQNVRILVIDRDVNEQNQRSIRHFSPGVGQIRWQVPEYGFNWVMRRYKAVQQKP
jgi:hypothetical protein